MISISKAFKIIDRETVPLGSETIRLESTPGRVLAEDIAADSDMPPFDRSQMDGFAVRAEDTADVPVTLRIVGESAAGRGWHKKLKSREAIRIMAGAPVPGGADAVQRLEAARESSAGVSRVFHRSGVPNAPFVPDVPDVSASRREKGETVTILEPAEKGKFIVKKGSEIKTGEILFAAGTLIAEGMIAGMAAFGYAKVKMAKKPMVAIMSTGSEIVAVDQTPGRDQIRNSNSLMLKVLCEHAGASAELLPIAGDDLGKLKAEISKTEEVGKTDILVITGGVSVGKYDLTKAALKGLGAEVFFERVRLKPGKPAVFAKLGNMLVFGLPGNPVSTAVTFYLFVRRAIRRMQDAGSVDLKQGCAVAAGRMKGVAERETYLPVELETNKNGTLLAKPLKWGGSSDFVGFARAEALAKVPKGKQFDAGEIVEIVYL